MLLHFDLVYIGQDPLMWNFLQDIADKYDLTILKINSTKDIDLIKDDLSFTVVLTELHLDYNYEGFTVERVGLKYSYFAILTDEITEDCIHVSSSLFSGQEKYLVMKNNHCIFAFLNTKPINITSQQINKIPIEA